MYYYRRESVHSHGFLGRPDQALSTGYVSWTYVYRRSASMEIIMDDERGSVTSSAPVLNYIRILLQSSLICVGGTR